MGLNSEWNDFFGLDDHSDEYWSDDEIECISGTFEDWCDLNSKDLLNTWFLLQEQAQMYAVLNQRVTFSDFCEFMYELKPTQVNQEPESPDLKNLWISIGSPKTFYEFYVFYK